MTRFSCQQRDVVAVTYDMSEEYYYIVNAVTDSPANIFIYLLVFGQQNEAFQKALSGHTFELYEFAFELHVVCGKYVTLPTARIFGPEKSKVYFQISLCTVVILMI